jgi:hypothetical protein
MPSKTAFARVLAIVGSAIAWLPIAATVLTATIGSLRARTFLCDYLMPAELFPAALLGGLLLLGVALWTRRRRALIGGSLAAAAALLAATQGLAVLTGLASGREEPAGWRMGVVLAALAGYVVALLALGVGGMLLARDLFRGEAG